MNKSEFKKLKQAIWQTRMKYGRPKLTKKQLIEAHQLYINADKNIEKFKDILSKVMK